MLVIVLEFMEPDEFFSVNNDLRLNIKGQSIASCPKKHQFQSDRYNAADNEIFKNV